MRILLTRSQLYRFKCPFINKRYAPACEVCTDKALKVDTLWNGQRYDKGFCLCVTCHKEFKTIIFLIDWQYIARQNDGLKTNETKSNNHRAVYCFTLNWVWELNYFLKTANWVKSQKVLGTSCYSILNSQYSMIFSMI